MGRAGVKDGGDGWKGPSRTFFWLGGPLCWVARACAQQTSRRGGMVRWSERATREWMAIKRSPWGQSLVKRMCRQFSRHFCCCNTGRMAQYAVHTAKSSAVPVPTANKSEYDNMTWIPLPSDASEVLHSPGGGGVRRHGRMAGETACLHQKRKIQDGNDQGWTLPSPKTRTPPRTRGGQMEGTRLARATLDQKQISAGGQGVGCAKLSSPTPSKITC